jgi:hypothetical protein
MVFKPVSERLRICVHSNMAWLLQLITPAAAAATATATAAAAAAAAAELLIPDLNWRTASVFGVPIPPPLNIAIRPNKFEVSAPHALGHLCASWASRAALGK